MGEGAYPSADLMAAAWLEAAGLNGEAWRVVNRAFGAPETVTDGTRWRVFQGLRCAWPDLSWEQCARLSDLPATVDFGDLAQAIRQSGSTVFWPDVHRVFNILLTEAA